MSADTSKIARIRETAEGFVIYDYDGNRASYAVLVSDADAGEWARDMGYEEIIWEDVDAQPVTEQENFYSPTTEHPEKDLPQSPPPMTMAERKYWERHEEVTRLLERAQELVDAHAEAATAGGNPPDWTHVGDLGRVRELVNQLIAFLSPDDEAEA